MRVCTQVVRRSDMTNEREGKGLRLLAVSNLFPRPDAPGRGLFNAQLFGAMAASRAASSRPAFADMAVVCAVPEWRLWRWPAIRRWRPPEQVSGDFASVTYCPVFYVPGIGRALSARSYAWTLGPAVKSVTRGGDVVLTAWLYPDAVAVERALRGGGRRLWAMALGSDTFHLDGGGRRKAVLAATRGMDGLVAVCQPLADRLRRAGVEASRVYTIENGVDASRFRFRHRGEARRELERRFPGAPWAGNPAAKIVLFVGNLVRVKGPDLMLEAFARLVNTAGDEHLRLAMVGDGPMQRTLRRRARALGIDGRVTFAGARPHDEIPLWMNASDCLCLTSRSEGMPNAVTEALACGLPVVARDVGSCRTMLERLDGARVVTGDGDAAALAAAVNELLGKKVNREALGRAYGRYTWREQAERMLSAIEPQ